jgi:ribosomal protein S8
VSLHYVNDKELALLSMLIYPRVIEVIVKIMHKKGWIRDFKYSDIILFMICSMICTYCYIFEPKNLPPNYLRAINNFALITKGEGTIFATVAEQTTRDIENYYGVK